jgi:hypothetical protein
MTMKNRISRKHLHHQSETHRKMMRRFILIMFIPAFLTFLWVTMTPLYWIVTKDYTFLEQGPASQNDNMIKAQLHQNNPISNKGETNTLFIEKAYWENKLRLSKDDSISLSIDLVDSLVFLEMKGVVLRECKILYYDLNWSLKYFKQHPNFLSWLKNPFILQEDSASITKVPIKVIYAPESPIDAAQLLQKILPQEDPKVEFTLQFNRNLQFQIRQADSLDLLDNRETNIYYSDIMPSNNLTSIPVKMREYFPSRDYQIDILLSRADARAIYRAIPQNAQMALRM